MEYHKFNISSNLWTQSYSFLIDLNNNLVTGQSRAFTNTCKELVNSSDASLRQYIFLQIAWHLFHAKISTTSLTIQGFTQQGLFNFKNREKSLKCLRFLNI